MKPASFALLIPLFSSLTTAVCDDLLIEDFEGNSWGEWQVVGDAFGTAPATGTLPNQMAVGGFKGRQLVNSFRHGDMSTGTLTSPAFRIQRDFIAFLVGGGANPDVTGIELLIDGRSVRRSAGSESETLSQESWDVREFVNRKAQIRIFDSSQGGWGHINVDHIVQTNLRPDRFGLDVKLDAYRSSAGYMQEPLRPQAHFTPEINWMNDPNGLVWHRGEYHLFYQFNPAGNTWGHMSWGHAVSDDLMHWEHLPLAIPEEDGIMAFSGCCVVDHKNTSGFGTVDDPPIVAVYTGHGRGRQVQNLAWSVDNGRTWTKFAGNPVIDRNSKDFRDPKVFWHRETQRWVMVVSLAVEKVLVFYTSPDLKRWKEVSRFGPAGAPGKSNWECPDLFPLSVEGSDERLWVLEVDMGDGSVAGGSGGEYFVGHFNGTTFESLQGAKWVDYGRDFYAPVSWSDIPQTDGRRIWIGWMNNWETSQIPTAPWRSCMSVPRTLSLRKRTAESGNSEYVMVQQPVREFDALRGTTHRLSADGITWPPRRISTAEQLTELSFVLTCELLPGQARSCGLRLRTGANEYIEFGYDAADEAVYIDRRRSGNVDFHPAFPGRHNAPARVIDGKVNLTVIVDRSTIELFANDGETVISDRFFPSPGQAVLEAFCGNDSAGIRNIKLSQTKSVWNRAR